MINTKSKTLDLYCSEIRNHIQKADIDGAFKQLEELISLIDDSRYQDEMTILQFRYNLYKDDVKLGKTEVGVKSRQYAEIAHNLLQFLNNIDTQTTLKESNLTLKENQQKIDNVQESIALLSAKLNLNVEIAKERISRMGECWESMFNFENRLFTIVREFIENLLEEKELAEEVKGKLAAFKLHRNLDNLYNLLSDDELRSILSDCSITNDDHNKLLESMKLIFEDYNRADSVLERNKFWLGFEIYEEARKYHDCYPIFLSEYQNKNYSGCLLCLTHQKEAKMSIENAIKIFQNKYFE